MGKKLDLSCLHGIRCLCCLWIIGLHVYAFGAANVPLQDPMNVYIRNIPILGFFLNSSLAVDTFWLLSGFLCEYQLQLKVDITKPYYYIYFMLNRFLRIAPSHYLMVTFGLMFPTSPCDGLGQRVAAYSFFEIPFFIDKELHGAACSGVGWTLNTDVHAYVVMVILFVVLGKLAVNERMYVYYLLFGVSTLVSVFYAITMDIHWPTMIFGLEIGDPNVTEAIIQNALEKDPNFDTSQIPNPFVYYPDFDPNKPEYVQFRRRQFDYLENIYFTSIERHGTALFLGAVMAINLIYFMNNKPSTIWIYSKLMVGFILFYIVHELRKDTEYRPPYWTALYDKIFALSAFFIIESMVYIGNTPSLLGSVINKVFGNKIFKMFSKFTYAIYLVHIIPVFVIMGQTKFPLRKDDDGNVICDLSLMYVFEAIIYVLGISLFVGVILYYIIEYPCNKLRYKYIQPKYALKSDVKTD